MTMVINLENKENQKIKNSLKFDHKFILNYNIIYSRIPSFPENRQAKENLFETDREV